MRNAKMLEIFQFFKTEPIPIEKNTDPDQNYSKIEILQKYCN